MYLLIRPRHVSALLMGIFKNLISLLACAADGSTDLVGILHIIKIIILRIKCYDKKEPTRCHSYRCLFSEGKCVVQKPEMCKNWLLHHDNVPAHTSLAVREFLTNIT